MRLREQLGVSGALAQVLVRRGLAEPARARAFLAADEEHSPSCFAGIEESVALIAGHLRGGSRITVHGDYDVDGICSTAILVRALRELGADVDSYLPDRASDGYGLSMNTVQRLAARGTRLLITADCGVTAVEEAAAAQALGMDVVVSDHHSPRADGVLPKAPLVHPALCGYPCPDLCAAGVAYKLAQALFAAVGRNPRELERDLDLVALATIADVVALRGENRTLVRRGLQALAATSKPGLRALMAVAGVDRAKLGERAVAFALAPRLKAAGRLYRADAGLELVLTEDRTRAQQIAQELDSANHERRQVETRIRYEAEAQLAEQGERAAYVLAGEDWHAGVIGIVASRMVELSGRPVVMVALDGDTGKGSGRSIAGFDLLAGLTACQSRLLRYGGHRAAGGLELGRTRLEDFRAAFCEYAELVLGSGELTKIEHVDAIVAGTDLSMDLAEELAGMAPFGQGNPTVSLMLADAVFSDSRPMGEGKHVRFSVESRGAKARAVAFGNGGRLSVRDGVPVQATFTLEVNEWNGVSEPRLLLRQAAELPAVDLSELDSGSQPVEVRVRKIAAARAPREDEDLVLFPVP